ncbi:MAG: hypothetical protein ACTSXT_13665 [Candidatus Helarchaeota archaeon]
MNLLAELKILENNITVLKNFKEDLIALKEDHLLKTNFRCYNLIPKILNSTIEIMVNDINKQKNDLFKYLKSKEDLPF